MDKYTELTSTHNIVGKDQFSDCWLLIADCWLLDYNDYIGSCCTSIQWSYLWTVWEITRDIIQRWWRWRPILNHTELTRYDTPELIWSLACCFHPCCVYMAYDLQCLDSHAYQRLHPLSGHPMGTLGHAYQSGVYNKERVSDRKLQNSYSFVGMRLL